MLRLKKENKRFIYISIVLSIFTGIIFFLLMLFRMEGLSSSITERLYKEKLKGDLNSIQKYIYEYYGSINREENELYDARWNSIENDYVFIDRLKSELNVEATIFLKQGLDFVRMTTTIKDLQGERAIGTTLGSSSEAYQSVISGKSYIGKAHILNKEYIAGYQPIYTAGNEIIGLIFIGIPSVDAQKTTADIFTHTILYIILAMIFCIMIYSFALYYVASRMGS